MSKTKTLSVRVPMDVYEMIENTCKQRGMNRNQLLSEVICQKGTGVGLQNYSEGSVTTIPNELNDLLAGIGGVATGTLVYHLLNNHLPYDRWDEDTRIALIWGASFSVGLLGGYGISKLLKK